MKNSKSQSRRSRPQSPAALQRSDGFAVCPARTGVDAHCEAQLRSPEPGHPWRCDKCGWKGSVADFVPLSPKLSHVELVAKYHELQGVEDAVQADSDDLERQRAFRNEFTTPGTKPPAEGYTWVKQPMLNAIRSKPRSRSRAVNSPALPLRKPSSLMKPKVMEMRIDKVIAILKMKRHDFKQLSEPPPGKPWPLKQSVKAALGGPDKWHEGWGEKTFRTAWQGMRDRAKHPS